jgi:hypothetical protein
MAGVSRRGRGGIGRADRSSHGGVDHMDGGSRLRPAAASLVGQGTGDGMAGVSRRAMDGRVRADRSMIRGHAEADASAARQAGLTPRVARSTDVLGAPPLGGGAPRTSGARPRGGWNRGGMGSASGAEPGRATGRVDAQHAWEAGSRGRRGRTDGRLTSSIPPRDPIRNRGLPEARTTPLREPAPHACCASTLPVAQPGSAPQAEPIPPRFQPPRGRAPDVRGAPPPEGGAPSTSVLRATRGVSPACRAAEA